MDENLRKEKIQEIEQHLARVYELSDELGYENIFYNEGFYELLLAEKLGHTWNYKTRGHDATLPNGELAEYKTCRPGGTFQFHWLGGKKMERLAKIQWTYFAYRDRLNFSEIHRIPMMNLIPMLEDASSLKGGSLHLGFNFQELLDMGAVPAPEIT